LHSEPYVRVYGQQAIDEWPARNQCPQNDKLCEQSVWFYQTVLLTDRTRMEQIAVAIQKIRKYAKELQKA